MKIRKSNGLSKKRVNVVSSSEIVNCLPFLITGSSDSSLVTSRLFPAYQNILKPLTHPGDAWSPRRLSFPRRFGCLSTVNANLGFHWPASDCYTQFVISIFIHLNRLKTLVCALKMPVMSGWNQWIFGIFWLGHCLRQPGASGDSASGKSALHARC